jgi:hypothetical protein
MPTIKFKLKDPKYCNGCPCLRLELSPAYQFPNEKEYNIDCCFNKSLNCQANKNDLINRPQSCIDKFGE